MSLYIVQNDGEAFYIEAPNMHGAIETWRQHVAKLSDLPTTDVEDPESITQMHKGDILR